MFFDESRPDRQKRAKKLAGPSARQLINSPIPPAKSYELFTTDEVLHGGDRTLICDVESYPNYFLIAFRCVATGKVLYFEDSPNSVIDTYALGWVINRFTIVTFNGNNYDMPIILVAVQGVRAPKLHEITTEIIQGGMRGYEVERKYGVTTRFINHIDLIEVAPIEASLKLYAARLHCERMQDLPYPPDTELTYEQAVNVKDYCINDLDNTELLFKFLKPEIDLREELGREYETDLRSKSDAQVAEAVIIAELGELGKVSKKDSLEPGDTFYYKVPDFISFKTPQLQHVLEVIRSTAFIVGNAGSAACPEAIAELKPRLGGCVYRIGVGGLHSSEQSVGYVATEDTLLIDRDVESYYPNIMLNQGLYPEHLGPAFLDVYRTIVQRRLKAKRDGDKAVNQSLKIVINGTFGKLGNQYSRLQSPELLTQVTMTGQLALLMLIEMVELAGIPVVSGNTDGIVMRVPTYKVDDLTHVLTVWEEQTGFVTEETRYRALYSRDVNNYIAIKEDGTCKTKGIYSEVGSALNSPLSKNPETYICSMAVQAFLAHRTPLAETIENYGANVPAKHYPTLISRFISIKRVVGGAEKDGVYLGKAVRWYYAKGETGCISTVMHGSKVPKTDGAKPLMMLPDGLPADLDFDYYLNEATEMLFDLGYYQRPQVGSLF